MSAAKTRPTKQHFYDALDEILDRPVAYHRAFRKLTGRSSAAVWLSQQYYWSKRGKDPDGWVYKSARECTEETGLTDNEQLTAREICKKLGIVEEKLRGVPATLHYRLNRPKLYELLGVQFPAEQETEIPGGPGTEIPAAPETSFPDGREIPEKQESDPAGNFNKESENTTVIPPENTNQELDFQNSWQRVIDEVQRDTPRASFDTHIRDTRAVRFDGNVLEVAAGNEEARAWLESRLTRSAENLLIGILNAEVSVVFVVAEEVPS